MKLGFVSHQTRYVLYKILDDVVLVQVIYVISVFPIVFFEGSFLFAFVIYKVM